MTEQQQWFTRRPGQSEFVSYGLALESETDAYKGQVNNARDLTKDAVGSAKRYDHQENGAIYKANFALQQAAYGVAKEAKESADEALKLAPESRGAKSEAALAFAMAGYMAQAESLMKDLDTSYHQDTQIQSLWLPAIKAQLALEKKDPASALKELHDAETIEFGQIPFADNISCLYPTYVRGEAYRAAGQGKEAAAEFQKILDHSGIVWNCWTGALAHLGVARAYVISGDTAKAKDNYKDFLTLWHDADSDIPILKQAKAEYAKLQ
jgi:tetratricopeptide (TPR) repeat protein